MSIFSTLITSEFLFSVIRITTPILLAAMGTMLTQSTGVINVVQEGTMLIAAFVSMAVSAYTQSVILGLLGGIIAGMFVMAIMALFTLRYRSDSILVGLAINMFASGGTVFFLFVLTGGAKGNSISLPSLIVPNVELPLIKDIPFIGKVLSGQPILTYIAILSVFAVSILLKRTPLGRHMQAVGYNPDAARSTGVNVDRIKIYSMLMCGVLCGLGGSFMSMSYVSWFSRNMVAGRGWIAISATTLGTTTGGTALASLMFGAAEAFANLIGMLGLPGDLVKTFPYWVTIAVLLISAIVKQRKVKLPKVQ